MFQRRPCPEEEAHFLSRITWWWQNGQIWSGWRRPIKYDDLADLNAVDKSRVIAPRFQRNWDRELRKAGLVECWTSLFLALLSKLSFPPHSPRSPTSTAFRFDFFPPSLLPSPPPPVNCPFLVSLCPLLSASILLNITQMRKQKRRTSLNSMIQSRLAQQTRSPSRRPHTVRKDRAAVQRREGRKVHLWSWH